MTERLTDEERQRLIAGDRASSLPPEEAADLSLLADLLADPSTWAEPGSGLEDAVVQAVMSAAAPAGVTPLRPSRRADGAVHRWRWRILSAAAVLVIIAGAVLAAQRGSKPSFRSELAATGLAPGARGSAAITRNAGGFRVVLDARGLSPLPTGQYYEAWLKGAAGTLVPIGTFSSSDARVTLWSGVSPQVFPTMTVTIESADNNQASSGHVVLAGPVHPST
jgi:anti-sigma-K factor RskA